MPSRSAFLIVRDEQECLERCLHSLREVVEEVVVVDTGSRDGTVEIARAWADCVCSFPWADDFSAARNFAIEQASGEYLLMIDADNWITNPEAAGGLLAAFAARHGDDVVGTVEITNVVGAGADAKAVLEVAPRFFRRGRFRYEGAIHEQLVPVGGGMRLAPTGLRYHHTGYAHDVASPRHKSRRNKPMLLKAVAEDPDDEYYLYQLGKAHFCLNEFDEAGEAFERALACIRFESDGRALGRAGAVAAEVLTDLVVSLAYAYANTGRLAEAKTHLETHQALGHAGTNSADFQHARGYVYLMLGDVARAKAAYQQALRLGTASEQVVGAAGFSSHYHLGLLCEAEEDVAGALACYAEALEANPRYAPALARCIDVIVERRVPLPAEVWRACDREAFVAAYVHKLEGLLAQKDTSAAALLIEAARRVAPELHARCIAQVGGR